MVNRIIDKGKKIFSAPQSTILSAATVIMLMIVASRVLGLVRQRTLAHFFAAEEISLFFAAFRLPDTIFEVLVFGTFSSAFIPVFVKAVEKDKKYAWHLAARVANIGLLAFVFLGLIMSFFADGIYSFIAPGFSDYERLQIVQLSRILFAAQGFFVVSYVLTGVLESMRRFLVPALAPLFYNLGIILGTIFLYERFSLVAPAIGVFVGAMLHFLIQLPLAIKLGFRILPSVKIDKGVKKIARLAAPRVLELSFSQIVKSVELYLSSFISTASYAYYSLGNTIQLLPVGLFGTSIAKAALPTLSSQSDNPKEFKRSLWNSLYQVIFLVMPFVVILIVLRIPIVRLIYGTEIFTWESTVQTGWVVSAFAVGVVFQASTALLARGFYALHDTRRPMVISIFSMTVMVALNFLFIKIFNFQVWGLAASFSIGSAIQAILLFIFIRRKLTDESLMLRLIPMFKAFISSFASGMVMFFLLKFFDRSVWIKRLSFITNIEAIKNLPFEKFVVDTRYTGNLLLFTIIISSIGISVYVVLSILVKSKEVWVFFNIVKRILLKQKHIFIPKRKMEPVSPNPMDTEGQ